MGREFLLNRQGSSFLEARGLIMNAILIFFETVVVCEVLYLSQKLIYLVFRNLARQSSVHICRHSNEIGI